MIKKMLAMLVAISCAFGAWADTHISGTDFSGLTADEPFYTQRDDSGADSATSFWYSGDTSDFEGKIVTDGLANYLDFESNITNPLYRTINNCKNLTPSQFTATPIGTGLFIDTHVQFTPYLVNENHPAPSKLANDDKLIVWVRETEVDGDANITNLIITAGYIAQNGNVSASNYVANLSSAAVSALCDGQHRLTIKSYQNITAYSGVTVMGFVVYIDETVVEYIGDAFADDSVFLTLVPGPAQYYSQGGGHNKLLPCLMDYGTDPSTIDSYSKLTAVGYAGMGKIGDVIFDNYNTTYPAFAGDDLAFQVVLGDGVTSFDYLGDTYTTNASFTVDATTASVTISNVLYDTTAGYTHKTGTWHNNVAVDNQVGAGGDYGTFLFANGTILTLVGFQANYIVNGTEYDNLTDALEAALDGGYPLVLNNDIVIPAAEGGFLEVGENDELTIDLNGHTIQGTSLLNATIENLGGTLTITDTSLSQAGKVLNSPLNLCLALYDGLTTLEAGQYEEIDDLNAAPTMVFVINGGSFRDENYVPGVGVFYLQTYVTTGKTVSWNQVSGDWYATVGGSVVTTWDITFSTNNVVVTEWNLTVDDGDPIGNHIPNFTGGSWDAPAPTAETVVNSDTNFNYTIAVQLSYFPQSTIEEQWADRDGTAAKPFVIRNDADFGGLKTDVAAGYNADKYFEVVVDNITLTDWVGIGTDETMSFQGTLNGNGNTVNVSFGSGKYRGLFGFINGATIENLTVNVTDIEVSGSTGGAAFVGQACGTNVLTAVKATGSLGTAVNRISHNAGGLVAYLIGPQTGPSASITYNNCTNAMDVYSTKNKLGGFLGWTSYNTSVTINNGVNLGNLSSTNTDNTQNNGVGGFIGWDYNDHTSVTMNGAISLGTVEMGTGHAGSFYGARSGTLAAATGVIQGLANQKPIGDPGNNQLHNFDWATIDGNVATYVTPASLVGGTVTYKAMQSASTAFTLTADDASLTIITNLCAYTGTVTVDSTLTAQGYELVEMADANGVTFTCAIPGPADPWEPASEDPADVAAKVDEVFGSESEVAAHVTTYAEYEALVTYIQSTTGAPATPDLLTEGQVDWMWKSYILGANPLFTTNVVVAITSLDANATAGKWDFVVKVTEGELTTAHSVVPAKVAALVKVTDSLSPASWDAPDPEDVHADLAPLLGTNLIKVTVDFGTDTSGFMKVSE